jgi:hypothetical protein
MKAIEVSPELILQYVTMDKNEVTLHLAIKALAEDGRKLKRNMYRMCQILGKQPVRLYEAEFKLKRRKLLQVHYSHDGAQEVAYWYVFDAPVGEAIESPRIVNLDDVRVEAPKPKTIWRRLRKAIVGTDLEDFSLTDGG